MTETMFSVSVFSNDEIHINKEEREKKPESFWDGVVLFVSMLGEHSVQSPLP